MTAQSTLGEALAAAVHRLAGPPDVLGHLTALLVDASALMGAEAAGLLVRGPLDRLELVGSTSHQSEELELYELQHDLGPCIESIRTGECVSGLADDLPRRWAEVGTAILDAGFRTVHAFPVLWHGSAIGALNLFHRRERPLTGEDEATGRTFATLAALVLSRPSDVSTDAVQQRVFEALESRLVVERAKGVLSYVWKVDMAAAFRLLVQAASDQRRPLLEMATRIVDDAGRP